RSRRATSASTPASRALRAARSTAGSKRRRRPRSSMSASSTSDATSGRPRLRTIRACPPARVAGRTTTRSPTRARESRSSTIRPPRSKNGSATRKRPRLSTVATIPSPLGCSRSRVALPAPPAAGPGGRLRLGLALALPLALALGAAWRLLTASARRADPRVPRGYDVGRSHLSGQDLERPVEGLVALGVGIVLRAHVGLQARAALGARAAEVAPAGQEVLPDGDVQRAAVVERQDLLEDALAERLDADELGALGVLQRARDDLRRRGGPVVDEHDRRQPAGDRLADGVERAGRHRAAAGGDDRSLGDEHARDQLRLGD